eukprot:8058280-Pyramimonas_sp.AAC.1
MKKPATETPATKPCRNPKAQHQLEADGSGAADRCPSPDGQEQVRGGHARVGLHAQAGQGSAAARTITAA